MQPEKGRYFFTSESVTEGHPDKVADQISDAILDTLIEQDPGSRVACETLVTTGMAVIAGEISTKGYADLPKVVRETIKEIGYNSSEMGFDWQTCAVISSIDHQSGDIAQGVDREDQLFQRSQQVKLSQPISMNIWDIIMKSQQMLKFQNLS